MVTLTKLNGEEIVVNADLVEFIEAMPECMLFMTTGRKIMVREPLDEVKRRLEAFYERRRAAYPVSVGGSGRSGADR
jgi:flagellar protein FlbD